MHGFALKYVNNVGSKTTVDKYNIWCGSELIKLQLKESIETVIEEVRLISLRKSNTGAAPKRGWASKTKISKANISFESSMKM